jgi:hypothetical protein
MPREPLRTMRTDWPRPVACCAPACCAPACCAIAAAVASAPTDTAALSPGT